MLRRIGKILGVTVLVVLLLLVISAILIQQEKVQSMLAKEATAWLGNKLKTKVSIDRIKIDILNRVHFEGLYIEDQQQDTLAYIHDFSAHSTSIISDLWNNKTSIIKNVELEGGVVNLLRLKDKNTWNYAFIEDAFASKEEDDTTSSTPPKIDFKNLTVRNVRFNMLDKWGGQDVVAKLGSLQLKMNGADLINSNFNVKSIDIQNTNFAFRDYVGGKPKTKKQKPDHSDWGTAFNPGNVIIALKKLDLKNVNFEYQLNNHQSKPGIFDERHIVAKNIQLDLEDLKISGDTIVADIVHLSTQERSGLDLKKLRAHVTLNQQLAELNNLYLETNRSVVRDYFSMRYQNFHDFNEYIDNVAMYARFKNSKIDKRDIAFFAGNISQIPKLTRLDGKAEGTVANLYFSRIHAVASNIDFKGKGHIIGLPDIDNTYFDLHADQLVTTGNEIIRIAPEANTDAIRWNQLSRVKYTGDFKGTIKKFDADGLLSTNHGNADFEIFMNLATPLPSYMGRVHTQKLNLGQILGREDIGVVSAQGTLEGKGFDFNDLAANVDATVSELFFDGTAYKNITIKGDVLDKKFNGLASSRDEKLGFDFEGNVDLSGENPAYDFKSDIIRVNLRTLGITQQDVLLKARVNLDFKGNNIDEFVGKAILHDVVVHYNKEEIRIPRMRLNSYYTDSLGKILDLKSTVADARVEGQYSLTGIDKAIRSFLHYYMPTYISEVALPDNEIFKFNLLVKDANKVIQFFDPKLLVDSGSVIRGDINTISQSLNLVGLVPNISYNGIRLSQVGVKSVGTRSLFTSDIIAGKFHVGTSEIVKDAKLGLEMSSDTLHFNLKTNPVDDFLGQAELDGKATAFSDKIQLEINPSTFIVKDDKYRLFSYHPVAFTNNGILLAKDVLIQNGNQQLIFNATHDGLVNNALLETQNIDLEKVSKYINLDDLVLKGRVNTEIKAYDIWGNTQITGKLNTVDYLRLNSDTLGAADILFDYDRARNILTIQEGSKIENQLSHLYTSGQIDLEKNELNIGADLNKTPISFASQYMVGIVDSLRGDATGKLDIQGSFDNPTILGDLLVRNGGLKILFTGCTYSLDDINLKLNKNAIVFDPIRIYDERPTPGTALLTGKITHSNYDKYRLKLNINSDDFLGLNTNELSGELFYGYIPSKVDIDITGAIDDITMNIEAEPLAKSQFYLPLTDGGDVGSYDFIKFRTLGRYQNEKSKRISSNYVKVNMNIKATPKVLATIILDPNTQEKIEARGSGNISLKVDLGNEIQMFNTFRVSSGIYKFNFRGLLSKDFDLEEDGTITWNGDPYKAMLDMKAVYKTKASIYSLISDEIEQSSANQSNSELDEEIRRSKNLEDTYVTIDLTGPLSKPNILFDITQPNNRSIGGIAQEKLLQIRQDQNKVIYQAGMLLLFNSFKPSTGGLDAGNLGYSTTLSTASDFVGAALSQGLTSGINKLGIPNISINVGYKNYSADVSSGNFGRRDQVNLGFQASLFKDRFLVDFGNSLDFADANAQANGSNKFTYGGDFRGQYLLTLDGRYRLNAFRVSNFDYVLNEPVTRGGVGLSYKRSFNKWSDLFRRKKRRRGDDKTEKKDVQTGSIKKEESLDSATLDSILSLVSF